MKYILLILLLSSCVDSYTQPTFQCRVRGTQVRGVKCKQYPNGNVKVTVENGEVGTYWHSKVSWFSQYHKPKELEATCEVMREKDIPILGLLCIKKRNDMVIVKTLSTGHLMVVHSSIVKYKGWRRNLKKAME